MGCFCWSMLPECYLGRVGGSVSESNRSSAFGPFSSFEDCAHHRMKYASGTSLPHPFLGPTAHRRPPSHAWKSLAVCRNRPRIVGYDFPNGIQKRTGQERLPNESELRVPFGLPGDQDDGHCRKLRLHSLSKGHSVAVWHVDVADDQSNLVSKFLDDPKTVGTVSSLDGLEILPLQNGADELPNGRLVINDKRDASHASLDGQLAREGSEGLPIRSLLKKGHFR